MTVRTRFAPSPTGYLHIGGVRTALFCWLFARQNGGQFILRIDDTDQQRNVEDALAPILDGLRWLGIDWDEGPGVNGPFAPYYQSQRSEKYQAAVEKLLKNGCAYRDFATAEELQAERDTAIAEKRTFTYSRKFMAETDDRRKKFEAEGRTAVIRLKMPREGTLVIDDLIRGKVEFRWADEQDHVIQRADGSFIYHLASVVDDEDFQISHVIRAEEHLSNTPRQIFILQSLGYRLPQYAHLPFVAEPGSKTKLSKRKLDKYLKNADFAKLVEHGQKIAARIGLETAAESFNPVIVDFYKQTGFLPEAIVNYIAMLGWALDDKREFFLPADLIEFFSLEAVSKGPASFDAKKLMAFQERHFQRLSLAEKCEKCRPFLDKWTLRNTGLMPASDKMEPLIEAAGDRIKVAGDILEFDEFLAGDSGLRYDEAAFEKRLVADTGALPLLKELREVLREADMVNTSLFETVFQRFLETYGLKPNQLIHALRVAVTGKSTGIGMFEAMALLGKQSVLSRLDAAIRLATQKTAPPSPGPISPS